MKAMTAIVKTFRLSDQTTKEAMEEAKEIKATAPAESKGNVTSFEDFGKECCEHLGQPYEAPTAG